FRPSARKVRDQTGCPSPSAHRQLGLPQRRCVRASEPGRASGGIRRLRSKACLRWRKRAAGSPFASYQLICVSYNTQIAYCQHNSSGGGICARHRCRIFNVYVVLQGWAGSPAPTAPRDRAFAADQLTLRHLPCAWTFSAESRTVYIVFGSVPSIERTDPGKFPKIAMSVDVSKQLDRAARSLERNRLEDAVEAYEAVVSEMPGHSEALQ